jgi:hypothetical protein
LYASRDHKSFQKSHRERLNILYVQYTVSASLMDFEIIRNKDIMHTFPNMYVKQSTVVSRIKQMIL